MDKDNISDANRYVVSTEHVGPIFPTSLRELARAVYLRDGAVVKGGIFANALQISGGRVTAEQSVFAQSFIKIQMEAPGLINFKSSVVTEKSILIEGTGSGNHIRLRGDLVVDSGHLRNMIVYGNIYGNKLVLEDCAVFGGVFAREDLAVRHSLIGTFFGRDVVLDEGTTLWLTNGVARNSLELRGAIRGFTFALPKLFADLVTVGGEQIPDSTIPLSTEDIKSLPLQPILTALESRFPKEAEGGAGPSEESQGGIPAAAPAPAMIPSSVAQSGIIPDDELREYLEFFKDNAAPDESLKYFSLEPRLFNVAPGRDAMALNRAMHRMFLDPSGHIADEHKFEVIDQAVLDYLGGRA